MIKRALWFIGLWMYLSFLAVCLVHAQNPQTQTAPLFATNAKYTNGTAPGYWPTQQAVGARPVATGLNINVGPGTANCGSGTIIQYAGGTFALTASATNRIYLNTASSCAPAVKTTAFVSADIPIAVVVTSGSAITSILDNRTPFQVTSAGTVVWGGITGTLSDQTDLAAALAAKAPIASPHFTGTVQLPITGLVQCIHADSSGNLSGTGVDCGAGGSSYTNVVASSSADTTVAAINAKCVGGQTYVASIPLSISTGGTIAAGCNVSHWFGGVWTIASGQNVTFTNPVKEVGAPSSFFAGSGTVTLAKQDVPPEWFGAVGNGVWAVGSFTGTDNGPAFTKTIAAMTAGHLLLQCSQYYTSTTITIASKNNVGIKGSCQGAKGLSTTSLLFTADGTTDVVDVHGTAATDTGYSYYNEFSDFEIRRTVTGTTGIALRSEDTCGETVDRVQTNSQNGFYLKGVGNCGVGRFSDTDAQFSCEGASTGGSHITLGGTALYGYFLDGLDGTHFDSTILVRPAVGACVAATTVTGIKAFGTAINDFSITGYQGEFINDELWIDGTGAPAFSGGDIKIDTAILDNCLNTCFKVTNVPESSTPGISFTNSQSTAIGGANGVLISNSAGVHIENLFSNPTPAGSTTAAIYILNSQLIGVSNSQCYMGWGAGTYKNDGACLVVDNATQFTITGNRFLINPTVNIKNVKFINNTTDGSFEGNMLSGGGSGNIGIFADSSTSHIHWLNNNSSASGYTVGISDAGTDNQIGTAAGSVGAIQTSDGSGKLVGTVLNGLLKGNGSAIPSVANQSDLSSPGYVVDSGAADVYAATLVPAITTYGTGGLSLRVKISHTNTTTTPTLNVNGLGTKTIVKNGAGALIAGDVAAGQIQTFQYDGTNFQLLNPATVVGNVTGTSPIVVTPSGGTYNVGCPTCGVSAATAVNNNAGATLGTSQQDGFLPYLCADSSGSSSAQTCNTATSFTVTSGNCFLYKTTTTNSGAGLTVNPNSLGAKSVAVPGSSGWTTTLIANAIPINKPLTMCYDGTNLNLQATGIAGGLPAKETHTASASAELDFTTCISASYKNYQIIVDNIVLATANSDLLLQVSTDGGSTYQTSSYLNAVIRWTSGANGEAGGTTGMRLSNGVGESSNSTTAGGIAGTFTLYDPLNSSYVKVLTGSGFEWNHDPQNVGFASSTEWNSSTAVNAFRIISSSGNLTQGSASCQPLP